MHCLPRMSDVIARGQPHKSTTDPADEQDVITVRLRNASDKRVDTIHIHKDGTSTKRA